MLLYATMIPDDAGEAFLDHCRARRLAPKTLQGYEWALAKLPRPFPLSSADFRCAFNALDHLSDVAVAAVRVKVSTFYRWASAEYQHPDVTPLIPLIRPRRRLPRVFTDDDVSRLSAAARHTVDLAILALGLRVGLRLGEIASFRSDWLGGGGVMKVEGKTGQHVVAIAQDVIDLCRPALDGDGRLRGPAGSLGLWGVTSRYRRMVDAAGIAREKAGPHTMRHTFATRFMQAGGSLVVLQQQLGHATIRSTEIYVHLAAVDVVRLGLPFMPAFELKLKREGAE
jgi:integrase